MYKITIKRKNTKETIAIINYCYVVKENDEIALMFDKNNNYIGIVNLLSNEIEIEEQKGGA